MPDHNKGQSINQWNVCEEAEDYEEVLAHALAIRTILAPHVIRARQNHRAHGEPTPLPTNDDALLLEQKSA